jgi:hypothetical protein
MQLGYVATHDDLASDPPVGQRLLERPPDIAQDIVVHVRPG